MKTGFRNALVVLVGFALVLALSDCAKNPATGKRQLVLISEEQEIAIGRESHPSVLSEFGRVEDEELQRYVDRIGQEIAAISHRPDLEWHFTVVDSPVVNAFALPGGYIYITRQILTYMNNEAELAGVLGHEVGHVTARHSVSQLSKTQLIGLGIGVGGIFSQTFGQLSDLAQMGAQVLFLKFGRDAERQSDQLGAEYIVRAGYDPMQMSRFFEVFEQMRDENGGGVPSWLQSHPVPAERIVDTREMAQQLIDQRGGTGGLRVNSENYLNYLENLVFGENPREGFTKAGRFYHPDLRFVVDLPEHWKVENSRSAVLFVEPGQAAAAQLTLVPPDGGSSPEEVARALAERAGVEIVEGRRSSVHGHPSFLAVLQAQNPDGSTFRALGTFIAYGDYIYQFLGMGSSQGFAAHRETLQKLMTSFQELKDRSILDVQPDRVRLYQVRRGGTLADVARLFPNPRVELADLASLNRLDPEARLEAGTRVKVVESGGQR